MNGLGMGPDGHHKRTCGYSDLIRHRFRLSVPVIPERSRPPFRFEAQPATEADQDRGAGRPPCPHHHLPTGRGGRHRPDGPRHPRRDPPIANASVMRMTAIHVQTERKQQDRYARCDEKHRCRDRTRRFRGLIPPVSVACVTAGAAQDEKRLSSGRILAILASEGTPLGECRFRRVPCSSRSTT